MPIKYRKILVLLIFCFLKLNAEAAKGPVLLNADVAPGTWKAVRLKNLPKGATVALEIKSDGEIKVFLIDSADYQRFPNTSRPLFIGRVEKKLSFSVTIPTSGHYYVVFDNGSGRKLCKITLTIGAARGKTDPINMANTTLSVFEKQLHKLFVFESFKVAIEQCDHSRAFDGKIGIVLCSGYIQELYTHIEDMKQAKNALSFSVFHELSRILLTQWNHPQAAKKTTADELAAVLMIMLKQKKALTVYVENFVQDYRLSNNLAKALKDDRHPLTMQRAAKILAWLKEPGFVHRWQPFLIPHMQTAILQKLQQHPTVWTDLPLVKKELSFRTRKQAGWERRGSQAGRKRYFNQLFSMFHFFSEKDTLHFIPADSL